MLVVSDTKYSASLSFFSFFLFAYSQSEYLVYYLSKFKMYAILK